jgi:hypothetical protein
MLTLRKNISRALWPALDLINAELLTLFNNMEIPNHVNRFYRFKSFFPSLRRQMLTEKLCEISRKFVGEISVNFAKVS